MGNIGTIGLVLIIANIIFSYKGFTNQLFFDSYRFYVDKILINKDYKRLITSGFLHVSWTHLIFNMFSLVFFSGSIESYFGALPFLAVYFASLIGGNLLALLIHKQHGNYSSVGASGAVCGIIFASIALFPGMGIGFFGIPFSIPGWFYGIAFILFSIYGIKSKRNNIGHEAHLGGALVGMMAALIIEPSALLTNYVTILIIVVPTVAFIYLIITRPEFLLVDNYFQKSNKNFYSVDQKYNAEKKNRQNEIDRILDKIHIQGIKSLNENEKQMLKEYSETIQ